MARGTLRIYLGAAPGVGKTFAMLNEGWRRAERGTDVVVGIVETHGRPKTIEQLGDLEIVPRRTVELPRHHLRGDGPRRRARPGALPWRWSTSWPTRTCPGSRNDKRWQDVEELLAAGIDVISTVNIQHLESLNDVVEGITGITQRETVPDAVVRAADQIELVDIDARGAPSPHGPRQHLPAEKVDAALGNYFRAGQPLRPARARPAVGRRPRRRSTHRVPRAGTASRRPWETRERVVVAVTGAPGGDHLIRRAARIATPVEGRPRGRARPRRATACSGPDDLLDEHRALLLRARRPLHRGRGSRRPSRPARHGTRQSGPPSS